MAVQWRARHLLNGVDGEVPSSKIARYGRFVSGRRSALHIEVWDIVMPGKAPGSLAGRTFAEALGCAAVLKSGYRRVRFVPVGFVPNSCGGNRGRAR